MSNDIQRRRRRTGAEIEQMLHRYEQSELTQAEFVKKEGICLATLNRHLKKARTRVAAAPSAQADCFIEVEQKDEPLPSGSGQRRRDSYRLTIDGAMELEIPSGFCIREVASLLELISPSGRR
jgi:hypothetical protein